MPTWYVSGRKLNYLKAWRYPGIPIPERLKRTYTVDPQRIMPEGERKRRQVLKRAIHEVLSKLGR